MSAFFQRKRLSLLRYVAVLSAALALSGCGEDSPVTNYDNSTDTFTNVFDDAPVGVMSVSALCSGPVLLDSTGSYDPEGSALSYKWHLIEAPAGSNLGASFASVSTPRVSTLVDKAGLYVFQLTVFAGGKQAVTQTVSVSAAPPSREGLDNDYCFSYGSVADFPAAIRKGVVSARPGQSVALDAKLANDSDATYQWTMVSSPAGSAASLVGAGTPTPGLTPDVEGDYKLSVTVKKAGQAWAASVVVVRASRLEAIPLSHAVTASALIPGSKKVASISGDNTFRIHDLADGSNYAVPLPGSTVAFSISPDGSRALVVQRTVLSLINTGTHALMASWPIGTGGSSSGISISDVMMVNNQQAYVYAAQGGYYKLHPFNAETGALGSAIADFSYRAFNYFSEPVFQRFSTDAFFVNEKNSALFKVSLSPDGSVARVDQVTLESNCYSASLLSDTLMVSCEAVYGLNGIPPVVTFRSRMDLGTDQQYDFPEGGMVLSADGVGLYVFKNPNIYMPGDVLKVRTDTWSIEKAVVLPAVESGSFMMLPTTVKVLVDDGNPLVIVGRNSLPSGAYQYYLIRPY